MLVLPRQQGGARRRAHRSVGVEIRERHSLGGHSIEVGRFVVFVAVAANVTVTKIVGHDQYEIRFPFPLRCAGKATGAG